jgi:hypothetical protein
MKSNVLHIISFPAQREKHKLVYRIKIRHSTDDVCNGLYLKNCGLETNKKISMGGKKATTPVTDPLHPPRS